MSHSHPILPHYRPMLNQIYTALIVFEIGVTGFDITPDRKI